MSIVTIEEEIVDVNVRLKQVMRQWFPRKSSGIASNFQKRGSNFKTEPLFAGLTWLVVGNSEGKKDFVPTYNNYVEPCDLLDEFPQLIV